MGHEVRFAPEALDDLRRLYDHIARDAGAARAENFTDRIIAHCLRLELFPRRARCRDDLRPGLRLTTFRRRVTIAFHIAEQTVVIDRILYGGRDLPGLFGKDEDDSP